VQLYTATYALHCHKWRKLKLKTTAHKQDVVNNKLQAGGSHDMPRPSPPSVGAGAPRAAEPADGNVAVGSHNTFPRSPLQLPDALTPR